MKKPRTGDTVEGIPYNDEGRFADYIDVFPPDEPEGPLMGRLIQEMVDTWTGPSLHSYIVTEDRVSRKVESDRIVLYKSNSTPQDRIDQIREMIAKKPGTKSEIETEHKAGLPSLERAPGDNDNWVERSGGLPRYIDRIARHLHYEKGMSISRAIATAVNVVKKMCASGDLNFPGRQSANPKSRAEACKAVAQWEAKKRGGKKVDLLNLDSDRKYIIEVWGDDFGPQTKEYDEIATWLLQ